MSTHNAIESTIQKLSLCYYQIIQNENDIVTKEN